MLVTGKVVPCKTQRGEMEGNQWKTNLTHGSYIQRNRGNCLTTGGNSLARNKVSDKKKVPETIIFLFYHKWRTQRLFPSCVLLWWVWNMARLSGRFPPVVMMDRNMSKISICTANDAATKDYLTLSISAYNQFIISLQKKSWFLLFLFKFSQVSWISKHVFKVQVRWWS